MKPPLRERRACLAKLVKNRLTLTGFAKAVRETWPRTRVQRCTFHAFSQVKRYTTTRPKLQAGRELYLIARDLMGIETLHQAELWVERYLDWCGFWADFLEDRTVVDGRC